MYYHYQEIGRSANTAHLMQAVCPHTNFSHLILGDTESEIQLINEIIDENVRNEPMTCVLYPSKDAILLSEWIKQRPEKCRDMPIR